MANSDYTTRAPDLLAEIWQLTGLPQEALAQARLETHQPTLPSSFRIADVATATIAAAGLAASELWHLRGGERQTVTVDSRHAETEFLSEHHIRFGGEPPPDIWGPIAGVYQCGDGRWVRIHANYPHHEAGVLEVLECACTKQAVAATLRSWTAAAFEDACADRGLVVFMLRSPEEWAAHEHGRALAELPLLDIERIGDGPPQALPQGGDQPLSGIRVLDLTRVIAGPVCGRTLAAHGADVERISAARLPRDSIALEADGGRGKRSTFLDIKTDDGRAALAKRVETADIFVQGYRPGAIDAAGFQPEQLAEMRPGIVAVSLSAWGHAGPWSQRRGFDSLVQTATGFNVAEAKAAGSDDPKPLPCQAMDHASGYLMAMAAMAGLYKRATEGGSWRVRVALARTGHWVKGLGRVDGGFNRSAPNVDDVAEFIDPIASDYGELRVVRHAAQLSRTPASTTRVPQIYPHDS